MKDHRSALPARSARGLLKAALGVWALWAGAAPGAAPGLTPRPGLLPGVQGVPHKVEIREGETLLDVAFEHGLGFEHVVRLNPDVDIWIPEKGAVVELPTQLVVPMVEPRGLVINIPEMRLFDFTAGEAPRVIAVAIGDPEDPTPTGVFPIGNKRIDPTWNVPESIRAERPELPAAVPPGPDNPLGDRWMTLGRTSYGIHGTNNRWSIGHEATHGCVRLYNKDMRPLYERIAPGTPVQLVYLPVKLGRRRDGIFLEVHPDLYERAGDPELTARVELIALGLEGYVDLDLVARAAREQRGVPVRIGTLPEATTSERSY